MQVRNEIEWKPLGANFAMTLSIVIVNWNTRDLLRGCLRSIGESEFSEKFETIVVDNASTDGSAEMVVEEFPQVHLFAEKTNWGYAKGNNIGFERANGAFILALNPDTVLEKDTIESAVHSIRFNDACGALGAKLIGFEGETQASVRGFPSYMGIFGDATGLGKRFQSSALDSYRLTEFDYEAEGPAPQPMGTFLLFRRSALESVGDPRKPFDESFPIFFNEVDLLFRMAKQCWPCFYDPKIRVRHLGGAGTKQVRKAMIWESHRSLVRYMRKHNLQWWNFPAFLVFAIVVWLGALVRARGFHAGFRA